VKQYDTTYKKINEIRMKMSLGLRITDFGPCCLFRVIDTTSTLVKTPRPDPTVRCNRIQSIKNYRQCIGTIKKKKNRLQLNVSNDNNVLGIEQYFLNPIKTSHLGIFHKKQNPKLLHKWIAYKQRRRFGTQKNSTYNPFLGALVLPTFGLLIEAEVTNSTGIVTIIAWPNLKLMEHLVYRTVSLVMIVQHHCILPICPSHGLLVLVGRGTI
jgi:hypothetical protein